MEADNGSGILALFFMNELGWAIKYISKWIIGTEVLTNQGFGWSFLFCYFPTERSIKKGLWLMLFNVV